MMLFSHLFRKEPLGENRIAVIEVTAEALLTLFQLDGKRILRMEGVPADARVEAVWVNEAMRTVCIGIASEECPIVTEGTVAPVIHVTVYMNEWVPQEVLVS